MALEHLHAERALVIHGHSRRDGVDAVAVIPREPNKPRRLHGIALEVRLVPFENHSRLARAQESRSPFEHHCLCAFDINLHHRDVGMSHATPFEVQRGHRHAHDAPPGQALTAPEALEECFAGFADGKVQLAFHVCEALADDGPAFAKLAIGSRLP